ncbi:MAG: cohesin domain-containing protein [Cyclobacteriaceae bacterium]|nr:cohesin domain-containing protein [Cyclobacteriaceae bacterium]
MNPIPTTPTASNDGPVCEGANVTLSTPAVVGATYAWSGPNGFSSNLQNPVINSITAAGAGVYSVTVTLLGCPSLAGTTTVVVNPLPATPTASNDGPVCEGGTIQLSTPAVGGATYAWTGPNGFSSNLQNPTITNITAAGAGVYSVTINNGTCTSLPGTTTVVVNPIPATPAASNSGPVCEGGNVTLSTPAVVGATYAWTGPNGFSSNLQNPVINSITAADAGVYSVTVTLLGCPSLAGTTTVVVNPIPATPTASNDGPVCEGANVTLSTPAIVGATYAWTGPNGFSSNLQNPVINTITAAGAGVYSVTVTLLGCPSLAGTTTVVVNPLPATPTASNDGPVCEGGTIQLSTPAVGGATYAWTGPNGFSSNLQNPTIVNITAAGAGVYSVTINNGTCTSLPGTTTVVVNPIPVTPSASNSGPVCEGGNVTLSTPAVVGATYAWTGPNGFSSNLQNPVINSITAADAGVYSVTVTLLGCPSLAGTTTVVVSPIPATPTASNDGPVCEGANVTLSTPAIVGATYAWTGPNGFSSNLQNPVINNITAAGAGVYSVTVTLLGCPSLAGTTTVDVNPKPALITIAGNINPACQAIGEVYSVVGGQPGSTYAWSVPLGATIIGAITGPSIIVDFGLNNGNVTVIEQSSTGCFGDLASLAVNLQACPFTADFVTDLNIQCINGAILFTDASSAPIGTNYVWDFGAGASPATANTPGPHSVTYSTSGVKSITLTITDGVQTDQITKNVTINDLPTATLTGGETICPGGAALLNVALTGVGPWSFTYNDGSSDITIPINSSPFALNVSPVSSTTYSAVAVSDALCNGTVSGSALIDVSPAKVVTIRLDSISGSPNTQVKVPVRLIDFQDFVSMQFTIRWDPDLLTYNSIQDNLLPGASFGETGVASGTLNFSWNTLSDTTIADSTAIFAISFNIANTVCTDAPVSVDGSVTPIEVADENLCIATVNVFNGNVDIQSVATISSNVGNTICFGDQVLFTGLPGGQSQYDFYLNGVLAQSGANSIYLNSALADQDSVNVIIRDIQGCTLAANGIVMDVQQIQITPTITDITVCGGTDGAIAIVVSGGSGDYSYLWTGPSISTPTAQNQASLGRGFYSVTVIDNVSGCRERLDIELKEPVNFTLSATKSDVTSTGGNDGSINLTITGGTGPFTILWTGPNGFTSSNSTINGLFAGTYTATVRDDGEGCTDGIAIEILQPLNALILNATKTDVTSCGAMDGTINLIINGGSGSYLISWAGPNSFTSNNQNLSGLEGGLYIATVIDQVTTLTAQWTVQLDEPLSFSASASTTDISTCGGTDGSINLTVTGGSGNFAYSWKDLSGLGFTSSSQDISGLSIGLYRVVIADNITGCIDSLEARVGRPAICDQPCGLHVESTTNNTSCPDTEDGVAVINIISGGSGPGNYYVSLDSGKTFVPFEGLDITAIVDRGQGSYLYIVKDTVTGCRDTTVANVGVSTNLMANISVDDAGCLGNDGTITFNVSGGVVPFEVVLIDSVGNATVKSGTGFFQFMNLTAGSYFYTVKEQSGCTIVASDSIELGIDCVSGCTSLIATARNFVDATCASDPNGQAIIDVLGWFKSL